MGAAQRKGVGLARLAGKIAIITGAAKGLGEADARLFVQEGAQVILTDVDQEAGARLARDIGAGAEFRVLDVRDESGWEAMVADVVERYGGLDILVNNAGVVEPGTIETQTLAEYEFIMDISAKGTFLGCKYAYAAMKARGGGSIINMASIAAIMGEHYVAAYCAAKGAVTALTRAVAVNSARNGHNVRCNAVLPSGTLTPMVQAMPQKMISAGMVTPDQLASGVGQSKLATPQEIANAVLFLASDESSFINGTSLCVDNAMSIIAGVVPDPAVGS